MTMSDDPAVPPSGYSGTGTASDPYLIYTADGFEYLMVQCQSNAYEKHVELMADIDLSTCATPNEWRGYLNYFHGTLDGNGHTVSGISDNRYLIYAWYKGTISDFTLDLGGKAGAVVFMPMTSGGIYATTAMSNITVRSTTAAGNAPVTLTSNDQANYAPFLYASGPYFTMSGCTNYANISGPTYASAFYGYYPLPANNYPTDDAVGVKIENCTNHGDLTLRYAGLVFGNPTGLSAGRKISVDNLKNYGKIRGIESAHYFSADPSGEYYLSETGYHLTMENAISAEGMTLNCTEAGCPNVNSIGCLCVGDTLNGFKLEVDASTKRFVITAPSNKENIDHYVVTMTTPVSLYSGTGEDSVYIGTSRITLNHTISATAASLITNNRLRDYPIKDGTRPSGCATIDGPQGLFFESNGESSTYWLDNSADLVDGQYHPYLSHSKEPSSGSWDIYVSAYTSGDVLIDAVSLTRS